MTLIVELSDAEVRRAVLEYIRRTVPGTEGKQLVIALVASTSPPSVTAKVTIAEQPPTFDARD